MLYTQVGLSLVWGIAATAVIVILPIYESWAGLTAILQCKKPAPGRAQG